MKRMMIFALAALFSITTTFAQPPAGDDMPPPPPHELRMGRPNEMHQQRIIERLKETVDLSEKQQIEIEKILEDTSAKIKALEAKNEPLRAEIRAKLDALRTKNIEREEKRAQMKAIKDEMKPQMDEFHQKIQQIRIESKQQINAVLTMEQKAKLYEAMTEREFERGRMRIEKDKMKEKGKNTKRKP